MRRVLSFVSFSIQGVFPARGHTVPSVGGGVVYSMDKLVSARAQCVDDDRNTTVVEDQDRNGPLIEYVPRTK